MTIFKSLADIPPQEIWNGVVARVVEGRQITFGIVELPPASVVDRHQHVNEQIGVVLEGSLTFNIGTESRVLRAGDTYNIPSNVPHDVVTGPGGAVVVDVFSPVRADWNRFAKGTPRTPVWPAAVD